MSRTSKLVRQWCKEFDFEVVYIPDLPLVEQELQSLPLKAIIDIAGCKHKTPSDVTSRPAMLNLLKGMAYDSDNIPWIRSK